MQSATSRHLLAFAKPLVLVVLGVGQLGMCAAGLLTTNTPEDKLLLVEGRPKPGATFKKRGTKGEALHFSINGNEVEYPRAAPNYLQVVKTISEGRSARMWISKTSEGRIPRLAKTLYKLEYQDKTVLRYADSASYHAEARGSDPLVGFGFIFAGGAWAMIKFFVMQVIKHNSQSRYSPGR